MIVNDGITTMVIVIRTTTPLSQCRDGVSFSIVLLGVSRIASIKIQTTHFDSTLIRLIFILIFLSLHVSLALRQNLRCEP